MLGKTRARGKKPGQPPSFSRRWKCRKQTNRNSFSPSAAPGRPIATVGPRDERRPRVQRLRFAFHDPARCNQTRDVRRRKDLHGIDSMLKKKRTEKSRIPGASRHAPFLAFAPPPRKPRRGASTCSRVLGGGGSLQTAATGKSGSTLSCILKCVTPCLTRRRLIGPRGIGG